MTEQRLKFLIIQGTENLLNSKQVWLMSAPLWLQHPFFQKDRPLIFDKVCFQASETSREDTIADKNKFHLYSQEYKNCPRGG